MQKPNIDNFRVRCSAIGDIMADIKGGRKIPTGAQTYVEKWYKGVLYGKREMQGFSKYTQKGNDCEWEAVKMYSDIKGEFFDKNETLFSNDFLVGTPDIIYMGEVIDIKNSWDCFSFPLFDELPKGYWWQVQGYMALTGCTRAKVVFCLMDAPEVIIEREAWNVAKSMGEVLSDAVLADVTENMTYSNLPKEMRIKEFEVLFDADAIQRVQDRVLAMREYLRERTQ